VTARPALAITVAVFLCCLGLVAWLGDLPVATRSPASIGAHTTLAPNTTRAVLAVRDHVVPFQKWGTLMFTLPTLQRHYDEVRYFTMARRNDGIDVILAALRQLLSQYQSVDVLLLAHSNTLYWHVQTLEPELLHRLRLVYDTGCGDAYQSEQWRTLGADVHVGHPGAASVSPLFYFYFLRRWSAGWTIEDATQDANLRTATRLSLAEPFVDGLDLVGATRAVISGNSSLTLNSTVAPLENEKAVLP
jgi:hypothetical protein